MPNDPVKLIERDHRTVEQMFQEFEATAEREVALLICDELTVHAEVEEEAVYPAMENIDRDMTQRARDEHMEMKQLIGEIRNLSASSDRLVPLVAELQQSVEKHVAEEESAILPTLVLACNETTLGNMAREIERLKGQNTSMGTRTGATDLRQRTVIDLTRDELYEEAKRAGIAGRSRMTKQELANALGRR